MPPNRSLSRLKSVDFYKKIPSDLTEATLTGAWLSIAASVIMSSLLVLVSGKLGRRRASTKKRDGHAGVAGRGWRAALVVTWDPWSGKRAAGEQQGGRIRRRRRRPRRRRAATARPLPLLAATRRADGAEPVAPAAVHRI
jgi:hypothetical protein